ncbi:MAG: hypothetical protein ACK439_14710, partial [Novosphingobium sp.]
MTGRAVHKKTSSSNHRSTFRIATALLGTTVLAGVPQVALAQNASAPAPAPAPAVPAPAAPVATPIQSIAVVGSQRLEPDTIRSYIKLRNGQPYTQQ